MNYVIVAIGLALLLYDYWLITWAIGVGGWVFVIKHYWPAVVFDFTVAVFLAGFWGHIWIANKERHK